MNPSFCASPSFEVPYPILTFGDQLRNWGTGNNPDPATWRSLVLPYTNGRRMDSKERVIPNAMCHRQNPIALCYKVTCLLEAVCGHIAVSDAVWSHVMCYP